MIRELKSKITVNHVLHGDVTDNTALVGAIQDHRGSSSHTYIIHPGTLADADATFTALLEESDASNMAGATTVAAGDLLGTLTAVSFQFDSDNAPRSLGYKGNKRYTRLTITPANNTGAASISAVCIETPFVFGTVS